MSRWERRKRWEEQEREWEKARQGAHEEGTMKGDVVRTIGFMRNWIREHEDGCQACQYLEACEARIGAERRLLQLEEAQEREANEEGVIGDGSVAAADEEGARRCDERGEASVEIAAEIAQLSEGLRVETRREAQMGDEGVTIKETVEVTTNKQTPRELLVEGFDREMGRIQAGEPKVPLAIEEIVEVHIQLSTGGPGDGFKLWRDTDGTYVAGEYYYTDWGVRENLTLNYEEIDWIVGAYGIEGRGATAEEPWYEGM